MITPLSHTIPLGPLHPGHGIHDPSSGTPDRVPGSVRRTVTTDMLRPDGIDGRLVLAGRGRDLATTPDGTPRVLSTADMEAEVDFAGDWSLLSLDTDPPRPALQAVLGANAGAGFRGKVLTADPAVADEANLLHQLLDDIPVTTLVSGHAWGAETDRRGDRSTPSGKSFFGRDMCAGFADGGTLMTRVDEVGRPPVVTGPPAGELRTDDPWAWHELPPLPPHGMRRARRTDVVGGDRPRVDVLYRDSYLRPDGLETVIHEYEITLEFRDRVIHTIRATPRVLPWVECPAAAASAERLAGMPLAGLRTHVRKTFGGTSTCTHLNDTLRSLEDVPGLLAHLTG
ncbi:DUF2889 domain-containing protein [Pseudonocardia pini]|uniref:DUF2889 domain-containing protein n=1 Tax=Pseudonocardia pini TaxID=2758030 RepID=UPI0015EFFDDC|nr:DUF2889 domain-containing protein [Pseudonocardia pini]